MALFVRTISGEKFNPDLTVGFSLCGNTAIEIVVEMKIHYFYVLSFLS
jgi:hypothetical protein